jgi:hypothetical protein
MKKISCFCARATSSFKTKEKSPQREEKTVKETCGKGFRQARKGKREIIF